MAKGRERKNKTVIRSHATVSLITLLSSMSVSDLEVAIAPSVSAILQKRRHCWDCNRLGTLLGSFVLLQHGRGQAGYVILELLLNLRVEECQFRERER